MLGVSLGVGAGGVGAAGAGEDFAPLSGCCPFGFRENMFRKVFVVRPINPFFDGAAGSPTAPVGAFGARFNTLRVAFSPRPIMFLARPATAAARFRIVRSR